MCDHSLDAGGREAAMTIIRPGTAERNHRDGVWCDPCLAPLIRSLNDGGIATVASCCGHGNNMGSVILADGRFLVITPSKEAFDAMSLELPPPSARYAGLIERAREQAAHFSASRGQLFNDLADALESAHRTPEGDSRP